MEFLGPFRKREKERSPPNKPKRIPRCLRILPKDLRVGFSSSLTSGDTDVSRHELPRENPSPLILVALLLLFHRTYTCIYLYLKNIYMYICIYVCLYLQKRSYVYQCIYIHVGICKYRYRTLKPYMQNSLKKS